MKIKDIILLEGLSTEEIEQHIKKDCQPFLNEANGKSLYRGMGNASDAFLKKKTRLANRIPTDSPQLLHDMVNKHFVDVYGKPFRNGMFCTGNAEEASKYGNSYKVYPIGNFEYLWSSEIYDLYPEFDEGGWEGALYRLKQSGAIPKDADNYESDFPKDQLNRMVYKDFIDTDVVDANYQHNQGLQYAIDADVEIMVWCETYYAVKNST